MPSTDRFEAFLLSMHPWRRQPEDALQAMAETLKLPSGQVTKAKPKEGLWKEVDEKLTKESPEAALALAEEELAKAKQAGNKKAQALAMYLAIHVKVYQEDRTAIEKLPASLKEVSTLYKEAGDVMEEEDVMKDILEFHLANSQRDAAAKTEEEIRDRVRSSKKEEAPCLLRVAAVFYSMGAMEGARTLVEEAVAGFSSLGDQAGQVKSLRSLAVLYLSQQKFNDALTALEKALIGTAVEKANICYAQSQIYAAMGGSKGVSSAIESMQKARSFMQEGKNQDGELECLQIISELQLSSQKGDSALATGQEALAVTQASGNKSKEAAALLRLVSACLSSQNEAEALKYAEMAEMKAKEADDIEKEAQATSNVAEILLRRGDKVGAIKRSKEQLARCVERKHSAGQASAMVVLGQALLAENQASAEGMRYLQAALGIYKESDDFVGLYSAHFALANGYFTRGDLEDGLCHAREVLSCCRRSGDKVNEELVKANIERARQMTAQLRMTTPKRPSIENSGILLSPAGPQACHLRHSRVPGSLLDIVASGRNYWGTPRTVVDAASEADERPPSQCVIFGAAMQNAAAGWGDEQRAAARELELLKKAATSLDSERDEKQRMADERAQEVEDLKSAIQDHKRSLLEAQQALDDLRSTADRQQTHLEQQQGLKRDRSEHLEALRQRSERLKMELTERNNEVTCVLDDLQHMVKENQELHEEVRQLEMSVTARMADTRKQLQQQEMSAQELHALDLERADVARLHEQICLENREKEVTITRLNNDKDLARRVAGELAAELRRVQGLQDTWHDRAEQYQLDILVMQEQISDINQRVSSCEESQQKALEEDAKLKGDVAAAFNAAQGADRSEAVEAHAVASLRLRRHQIQSALQQTKVEIASQKRSAEQNWSQVSRLQELLDLGQVKLNRCTAELQALQKFQSASSTSPLAIGGEGSQSLTSKLKDLVEQRYAKVGELDAEQQRLKAEVLRLRAAQGT